MKPTKLTSAEKQKRYRERKKLDVEWIEKERRRKQNFRANLTGPKKQELKQKDRVRAKRNYDRLKIVSPVKLEEIDGTVYKTKQSFGKACRKVSSSLPKSPKKRNLILQTLAGMTKTTTRNKGKVLPQAVKTQVDDYFHSDEVSWQAPGRKDRIIVRNHEAGKLVKTYVQKRFLIMSLSEAYTLFIARHGRVLSFSSFCSIRPAHIDTFGNLPHTVCVCRIHENIRLLLVGLHAVEDLIPIGFRDFISEVVCNQNSKECMFGDCLECNEVLILGLKPTALEAEVQYKQWSKDADGRYVTTLVKTTANEAFNQLTKDLREFLVHTFTKREQHSHFEALKEKVDTENIVVEVDFSENFTIKDQNEIQSAHWTHKQATLFTSHAWVGADNNEPMIHWSDNLEHGKLAVYEFMKNIFAHLKNKYPAVQNIDVFSDGPSSQFKQRFLFSNLHIWEKEFNIKLTWHFFATSHGKGVVDGIGGTAKRVVWTRIRAGAEVKTPHDCYEVGI